MLTKTKKNHVYNFIFASLIFLALGVFTSPTIVSLYHIFLIIPTLILLKRGERLSLSKSSWFLVAIFVWGLVCNFVNYTDLVRPIKAFGELKYYLLGVVCIIPLRYFFINARDKHIKILFNIFFVTLIVGFFVGVSKAYFGFDIVKWREGSFGNRSGGFLNYMRYGYGSSFVFLFGVGISLHKDIFKKYLNFYLYHLAWILSFFAIFTAKTRGAILALIVGLPVLFLKYQKKLAMGVICIGALFIAVVLYISLFSHSQNRLLNINDGSNKKRMSQFYSATKSIQERPVFGLGANQFSYNVTRLKKKYDIWSIEYVGHSHNIFLEHATSYGIIGLFLFVAFLALWMYELYCTHGAQGWIFLSYLCAFIISGQVELLFDNLNSHMFFFVYSVSQVMSMSQQVKERFTKVATHS